MIKIKPDAELNFPCPECGSGGTPISKISVPGSIDKKTTCLYGILADDDFSFIGLLINSLRPNPWRIRRSLYLKIMIIFTRTGAQSLPLNNIASRIAGLKLHNDSCLSGR